MQAWADYLDGLKAGAKIIPSLRSQIVILKGGRGEHSKYLSFAFTEQGVAIQSD